MIESVLDTSSELAKPPLLLERWMKILGQPLIPIDLVERKTQLASAYEALAPHLEFIAEELQRKEK